MTAGMIAELEAAGFSTEPQGCGRWMVYIASPVGGWEGDRLDEEWEACDIILKSYGWWAYDGEDIWSHAEDRCYSHSYVEAKG